MSAPVAEFSELSAPLAQIVAIQPPQPTESAAEPEAAAAESPAAEAPSAAEPEAATAEAAPSAPSAAEPKAAVAEAAPAAPAEDKKVPAPRGRPRAGAAGGSTGAAKRAKK